MSKRDCVIGQARLSCRRLHERFVVLLVCMFFQIFVPEVEDFITDLNVTYAPILVRYKCIFYTNYERIIKCMYLDLFREQEITFYLLKAKENRLFKHRHLF